MRNIWPTVRFAFNDFVHLQLMKISQVCVGRGVVVALGVERTPVSLR